MKYYGVASHIVPSRFLDVCQAFVFCCPAYDAQPMEWVTHHAKFNDLFRRAADTDPAYRDVALSYAERQYNEVTRILSVLAKRSLELRATDPGMPD